MLKHSILLLLTLGVLSACYKGKKVDIIIHNAVVHTMTDDEHTFDAIAISQGTIIEVGPEQQILNKYRADEIIDASGKDVYPGFTDCHGHLLLYAKNLLNVDLTGSKSFDEVLVRLEKYQQKHHRKFIVGSGWDQSLWSNATFPTNEKLNKLFPTIPVCLMRVDGHAMLVNDALLRLAKINENTKIDGGTVHTTNGKCDGLLIDNAMNAVNSLIPTYPQKEISTKIQEIQDELVQYGITGVHEAGINFSDIQLFKSLIDKGLLKINVYAMLLATKENIDFAEKHGIYYYKNLRIQSFKVFGDGSLGSRGALLKQPYADDQSHQGALTTPLSTMKEIASVCEKTGYQLNTHAIGDSTNKLVLNLYKRIYGKKKDHRWRIEHAQVIDPKDIHLFGEYAIFPSVQPTHATSDQRWALKRIGSSRMKGAYAYKSLLNQFGMLAIGTDFPIEQTDPFLTIHAAVNRKNAENTPVNGFYPQEAISFNECIKGMTSWAAFASFQEKKLGTLEKGKDATLVIFEKPVRNSRVYSPNFAYITLIKGKKVYSVE